MRDEDVFDEAVRTEDWTHLAGSAADARAKSVRLRRTRYAGIAGATTAVAVVAAVVAGSLGAGAAGGRAISATPGGAQPVKAATSPKAAAPSSSESPAAPAKGTMGALFEQWKSCPDSELTAVNALPQDPPHLQQAWRDACHRDVATLSALLPDYDVTPAVASIGTPSSVASESINPTSFNDPSFVIPPGYTPHMGPSTYRIADKNGAATEVVIRAYNQNDNTKPANGEQVTLPNGLQGVLVLNDNPAHGQLGYEIYILDKGHTFYMFVMGPGKPNFDFKALATSPQFADMAAKALAEPES
ncbi:hypothetical protein KGQ19_24355 [Catenulispora sp. NL8]|uniref:Uncharacterized protein n=1 Tax=Catenulispora pinistramenti TaxID=2705254 RepID=A0ABS5KVB0_9ACTN|nr:hypothetical protein [Catenulispora pinistramenti]MBS2550001.1 hypothetical protein [Catenulispora pinistramenti]